MIRFGEIRNAISTFFSGDKLSETMNKKVAQKLYDGTIQHLSFEYEENKIDVFYYPEKIECCEYTKKDIVTELEIISLFKNNVLQNNISEDLLNYIRNENSKL